MSHFEKNRRIYEEAGVAAHYARAEGLQPAEEVIAREHDEELRAASMLNVGVGGGRTTAYFGPKVRAYLGVDYSEAMIREVRRKHPAFADRLHHADARHLDHADGTFDFTLFSYNGIDYVEHGDRVAIFAELRRVTRRGGLFVFSTHNLARDDMPFRWERSHGLFAAVLGAVRRARLRATNPEHASFAKAPHAMVNDGSFVFRAVTYHVRLGEQVRQLHEAGFSDVVAYSGRTGRRVELDGEPGDPWLYFTCRGA